MVTNASMFEKASKPHSLMLLIALVGLSAALSQKNFACYNLSSGSSSSEDWLKLFSQNYCKKLNIFSLLGSEQHGWMSCN